MRGVAGSSPALPTSATTAAGTDDGKGALRIIHPRRRRIVMNLLDLLYACGAVVLSPIWARKARGDWRQRFGHIPPLPPPADNRKRILLHAVSVGEVNALRGLAPMLVCGDGGAAADSAGSALDVVVSAGTDTGVARARSLFEGSPHMHVVRYPLDFSSSVRRFLNAVRPDAVALVELELWPNFIRECQRRNIPVGVVNGRLSARSFRGYQRARPLLRSTFSRLTFAAVQDETYARRFEAMGVPADRVLVTGSMKWDAARIEDEVDGASELAAALGIDRNRPLIVAGSTGPLPDKPPREDRPYGTMYSRAGCAFVAHGHKRDTALPDLPYPAEEALLHAACPEGVQLLCAPRRPERFEEAFLAMGGEGRCIRRSSGTRAAPGTDRFLLDTIGELRAAYALADVVVIGRSFGALYGSDPIEPVALGKPVLCGPRMSDFDSSMAPLLEARGILQLGAGELAETLARLINDPEERHAIADRGRGVILAQRGATARHAALIRTLLPPAPSDPRP